jgi:hypothetical protein
MKYNFDLQYAHFDPTSGIHTEVCMDTTANYGWFERYRMRTDIDIYIAEGGLWFEVCDEGYGVQLYDYDGVYELPKTVAWILKRAGIHVNEDYTEY